MKKTGNRLPQVAAMMAMVSLLGAGQAFGIAAVREWVGPTSGDQQWNVDANWTPVVVGTNPRTDYPKLPGSNENNGDRAVLGDNTGDFNLLTPNIATSVNGLYWTVTSASVGENRLTLQGNLTINGTNQLQLANATEDHEMMVVDLNGHTLTAGGGGTDDHAQTHLTIVSTGGPGVWSSGRFNLDGSYIGQGVTIEVGGSDLYKFGTHHADSTMRFTASQTIVRDGTGTIGNLQIGKSTDTSNAFITFNNFNWVLTMQGGVTIYAPTDGASLGLVSNSSGTASNTLAVAGDWIDHGSATAAHYGVGAIAFYGNPVTPRTISIARSLVNDFRVGDNGTAADKGGLADNAASTGNVMLGQNLTTAGNFLIRGGSRLDVVDHVLNVGSFNADSGAIIALSFGGPADGLIAVDGLLTLTGNLTIDVSALSGPLSNGANTLFTFGSYAGPSDLSTWSLIGDVPAGWTAQFLGNSIVLAVPEPQAVALLAAGIGLACSFRRRHNRQQGVVRAGSRS